VLVDVPFANGRVEHSLIVARILFLTQVLPYPLYGGAKIRAYYMLRHLAQTHEVTLVSFTREDDRAQDAAHLRGFCAAVHTAPMERSASKNLLSLAQSGARGEPLVIVRDRLPAMEALLRELVAEGSFDAVHADQTSMAYYGLMAREAHGTGKRPWLVLDEHNALYLVVRRQADYEGNFLRRNLWRREAGLLARYEASLLRDYDRVLTVSEEDRAALLRLLADGEAAEVGERVTAVPICVDPQSQEMVSPVDAGPVILHLGTMFWPPNVEGVLWFAREVLPLVRDEIPGARFVVAGKKPPGEVLALADGSGAVEVTGFVPDPARLLETAKVFVVPLLAGGGMRVKILDAWLWGLPMVSTTIGAEGILTLPGENILLADEPRAFAAEVVRVLRDGELARKLRENGRAHVELHYDWRKVYGRVDEIYGRAEIARS
jgi:glycosyltransferase involved in cell wall biosynthesis